MEAIGFGLLVGILWIVMNDIRHTDFSWSKNGRFLAIATMYGFLIILAVTLITWGKV